MTESVYNYKALAHFPVVSWRRLEAPLFTSSSPLSFHCSLPTFLLFRPFFVR